MKIMGGLDWMREDSEDIRAEDQTELRWQCPWCDELITSQVARTTRDLQWLHYTVSLECAKQQREKIEYERSEREKEKKIFVCDECKQEFFGENQYLQHRNTHRPRGELERECPHCAKRMNALNLSRHLAKVYAEEHDQKPFISESRNI